MLKEAVAAFGPPRYGLGLLPRLLDGGKERTSQGLDGEGIGTRDLDEFAELDGLLRLDALGLVHEGLEFCVEVSGFAGHGGVSLSEWLRRTVAEPRYALQEHGLDIGGPLRCIYRRPGRMRVSGEEGMLMALDWIGDDGEVHFTRRTLGSKAMVHAVVESLGEAGWDWQVWDERQVRQRYGLADTLEEAKAKAERALAEVVEELSRAA